MDKDSASTGKEQGVSMETTAGSIHPVTGSRETKARKKKTFFGFRLPLAGKTAIEEKAEALGISNSELMCRYLELGMQIDKYFEKGESQLVILDPKNWKRGNEVSIPYEQIIGDS